MKKQKIKKTKKPEKKIKTEDKAKLEKQPEKKTTVEKKPNTKTKEIKQRNSKKSDTFLIIGIIIMIILIVGAVIVTTILTRNKKSTVPESDANITDNVATGLTESEFRERYSKLMYDLTELSQKIQTELLSEIQVKQKPVFDKITAKLNLDKSKIDSCVAKNLNITSETKAEDAKILQKIVRDTQFAQMIGITGTPAIIINNDYAGGYLTYAELKEKIDVAMDGNAVEDLFYQEEDIYFGYENAKVVVYVYSDYYCSYCKKLAQESLMQLKSEYIDTGKIKYLPKEMVSSEPSAAVYANCAGEQGKYFEAELELFNNSSELSGNIQVVQNKLLEKYSEDVTRINSEMETLQKWVDENPESFSKIQESLEGQAQ
ncbi:MAG TPA: thioredoxin domain-containing protein [archaeon]|nr:thioredoxin domain-containing protein [archaeon]HPV65986.1 thioredoxin domain-containing protein [archaeon]